MSVETLSKMIEVKRMDLEECEYELNSRYYPSIVRVAMMNYIMVLRQQLEILPGNMDLNKVKME